MGMRRSQGQCGSLTLRLEYVLDVGGGGEGEKVKVGMGTQLFGKRYGHRCRIFLRNAANGIHIMYTYIHTCTSNHKP